MLSRLLFLVIGLATICASVARADITPHPLFADKAVVQRDHPFCPIWGTATPGEKISITVTAGDDNGAVVVMFQIAADKDGKWSAQLGPHKAGTKLTVTL